LSDSGEYGLVENRRQSAILPLSYIGVSFMPRPARTITTVSTKGQVILPSAIRKRREWAAGTQLIVEETPEGVLLRRTSAFAPTKPQDVFGLLPHSGPPKSLDAMDAAVMAEAGRKHAGD
jgi:AbrB family looped-hinge helix DNA binding protein